MDLDLWACLEGKKLSLTTEEMRYKMAVTKLACNNIRFFFMFHHISVALPLIFYTSAPGPVPGFEPGVNFYLDLCILLGLPHFHNIKSLY